MEFYSKNKFEKLVHLLGLIIRRQEDLKMLLYLNFKERGKSSQGYEYIFSASHVSTQYCKAVRYVPAGVSYVMLSGWQCL